MEKLPNRILPKYLPTMVAIVAAIELEGLLFSFCQLGVVEETVPVNLPVH